MKNKFSLLLIVLTCSFSDTLQPAQPPKHDLDELPIALPSGPAEQDKAEGIDEASEANDRKRRRTALLPFNIPSRAQPRAQRRERCTGYLAKVLAQPHYIPGYQTTLDGHAQTSVMPTSLDPDHFCKTTLLSPQSHLLVSLVAKACTSLNLPEHDLRRARCAIFDRFYPHEGNLPHANILVDTTCGLMPLLVFAICSPESPLSYDQITIIRILAEKSSGQMRTLALNDREARHRIKATPGLHDFPLFQMAKVCDCDSSEEEQEEEEPSHASE